MTRNSTRTSLILSVVLFSASLVGRVDAVTIGDVDAFTVDLEGWSQGRGPSGGSGLTRVANGGPGGSGDPFMQIVADAAGSHRGIVAFNLSPGWTGDYLQAGVTAISMSVNNSGPADLQLRLALGTSAAPENAGAWLASTSPVALPAGSGWTSIQFPLAAAGLTLVQDDGSGAYEIVMSNVTALRLVHSATPANRGSSITATLGVDNIQSLGIAPIPGDFDGNRMVDGADLTKWSIDFGVSNGSDADMDADSDGVDFLIWQQNFGLGTALVPAETSALAVAPEPSAISLMAVAAAALAGRRRRAASSNQVVRYPSRSAISSEAPPRSPLSAGRSAFTASFSLSDSSC